MGACCRALNETRRSGPIATTSPSVNHGVRREIAAAGNLRESTGKSVAAARPEDDLSVPFGRQAAIPVQFGFVRPSASIRQLASAYMGSMKHGWMRFAVESSFVSMETK